MKTYIITFEAGNDPVFLHCETYEKLRETMTFLRTLYDGGAKINDIKIEVHHVSFVQFDYPPMNPEFERKFPTEAKGGIIDPNTIYTFDSHEYTITNSGDGVLVTGYVPKEVANLIANNAVRGISIKGDDFVSTLPNDTFVEVKNNVN